MTVTYQVGGGGHMDIDFWVRSPFGPLVQLTADRPIVDGCGWPCTAQGHQAVNRHCFNHREKGWETRILLLESNELGLGQGRQVCQSWTPQIAAFLTTHTALMSTA